MQPCSRTPLNRFCSSFITTNYFRISAMWALCSLQLSFLVCVLLVVCLTLKSNWNFAATNKILSIILPFRTFVFFMQTMSLCVSWIRFSLLVIAAPFSSRLSDLLCVRTSLKIALATSWATRQYRNFDNKMKAINSSRWCDNSPVWSRFELPMTRSLKIPRILIHCKGDTFVTDCPWQTCRHS